MDIKRILSLVRRCVEDYNMIAPGDGVAVGVSGGKDSLLTLAALAKLREFFPVPFTVQAVTIDMGFEGVDFTKVTRFCGTLGVRHTIVPTRIAEIVFDIRKETHPCSLCAKLRRGSLHTAARELGCRKIALGHHKNDAAETFMLSLLYEGRLSCFKPVTYLDRMDVTLLRPLLYVEEGEVRRAARELPVVFNPCPANGHTKRQEAKELLETLGGGDALSQVFNAIKRLPLPGWETT